MKNINETLHIGRTLQKAIMAAFRLSDDHDQLPPCTTCAGRKHAGMILVDKKHLILFTKIINFKRLSLIDYYLQDYFYKNIVIKSGSK